MLVDVRHTERSQVLRAAAWFFCVLGSYYVLRPLREAMGIAGNVRELSRLFLVTLAVTLLATPIVAAAVTRFPRRRLVALAQHAFVVQLLAFWFLLRGPAPDPTIARVFFVWTSVYNLFSLALFWAVMADLFAREDATRLFGVIGTGGTLGAMAGSAATALLAPRLGNPPLLLLAALVLEVGVVIVGRMLRPEQTRQPEGEGGRVRTSAPAAGEATGGIPGGGVLRWLPGIARSPYLLVLVAYVLLFTFTSTAVYFEQARIVKASVASHEARTALFAKMDLAVNVTSVGLQGLIVAPALRRFGVAVVLAFLPLFTFAGFLVLRSAPILPILVGFQVLRRAGDYGIAKPAREVLFTVLPRQDKYKAKSFIDTFVYRAGDALGALAETAGWLVPLAIPLCLVWAWAAIVLGKRARSVSLSV